MNRRRKLPPAFIWLGVVPATTMLLVALFGPYLLTVDPNKQTLAAAFTGPFGDYILGADHLGRSLGARVVAGARSSLGLATLGVLASAVSGSVLGFLAAYHGGWARSVIMRLADAIIACPTLLFVILVSGLLGGGLVPVFFGIWMSQWPAFARLANAVAQRELASSHVEASRLLGFSTFYVLRRHVLPGAGPYLYSTAALTLGANVLTISAVGFLGIGLRPPNAEWGAMIAETMPYFRGTPHMVLVPAAAILICTFSATIIGEYFGARQQHNREAVA